MSNLQIHLHEGGGRKAEDDLGQFSSLCCPHPGIQMLIFLSCSIYPSLTLSHRGSSAQEKIARFLSVMWENKDKHMFGFLGFFLGGWGVGDGLMNEWMSFLHC